MKLRIALVVGFALSIVLAGASIVKGENEEEEKESEIINVFATEDIGKGPFPLMRQNRDFYVMVYVFINNTKYGEGKYQVNLTLTSDEDDDQSPIGILEDFGFTYAPDDKKGYANETLVVDANDANEYHFFYFPLETGDDSGTLVVEAELYYCNETSGKLERIDDDECKVPIGQVSGQCFGALILPLGIISIGLVCYQMDRKKKKR